MAEALSHNGAASSEFDQVNGLSVTEYAANPLESELHPPKPNAPPLVPKAFLAPDGYPDVRVLLALLTNSIYF